MSNITSSGGVQGSQKEGVLTSSVSQSFVRERNETFTEKIHQRTGMTKACVSARKQEPVEKRLKMQEREEPVVGTRSWGSWEEH